MDNATEQPTAVYTGGMKVASLDLNRPGRRNALSAEMLAELHRGLDAFEADDDARVLVLGGRGPSFCSGFDLDRKSASSASHTADPWGDRQRLRRWLELVLRIYETSRPVICRIQGHCLAGGILFTLCPDLVFVAEDAVLGWPRLPMGGGFMDGAMSLLIGQRRAKQISFMVGSRITGTEAERWGLANFAVPASDLVARTHEFAEVMARAPRNVLEIRKAAINRAHAGSGFREALLAGVEWDVIAHGDPTVDAYRAAVRTHGMKAVIKAFETSGDPLAELGTVPSDGEAQ